MYKQNRILGKLKLTFKNGTIKYLVKPILLAKLDKVVTSRQAKPVKET